MEESNANKWCGFGRHRKEGHSPVSRQSSEAGDEVPPPRKLNGCPAEMPSHQNLLRELLLSHKQGLLPGEKPELRRVLEQRRLEQQREQEAPDPSDLQAELRKRQHRIQEYEQEERRRRESQDQVPEFLRVREKLRRTQVSGQ